MEEGPNVHVVLGRRAGARWLCNYFGNSKTVLAAFWTLSFYLMRKRLRVFSRYTTVSGKRISKAGSESGIGHCCKQSSSLRSKSFVDEDVALLPGTSVHSCILEVRRLSMQTSPVHIIPFLKSDFKEEIIFKMLQHIPLVSWSDVQTEYFTKLKRERCWFGPVGLANCG